MLKNGYTINSLGDPAAKPDDQYQRYVCLEARPES